MTIAGQIGRRLGEATGDEGLSKGCKLGDAFCLEGLYDGDKSHTPGEVIAGFAGVGQIEKCLGEIHARCTPAKRAGEGRDRCRSWAIRIERGAAAVPLAVHAAAAVECDTNCTRIAQFPCIGNMGNDEVIARAVDVVRANRKRAKIAVQLTRTGLVTAPGSEQCSAGVEAAGSQHCSSGIVRHGNGVFRHRQAGTRHALVFCSGAVGEVTVGG